MIPARSHELRTYSITISIEQVQQIYSQEHNLSSSKHAVSGGQKKKTHITAATPLEDQRNTPQGIPTHYWI